MRVKVTICEDHRIVREGLREILSEDKDIEVMDAVENAESLLSALHKNPVHVVLLDLSLPGRSGIDVLKQVQQSYPRVNVMILTMHSASQFAVRAIKSGAKGFLNKDVDPQELINAIKTVAEGKQYLSDDVAEILFRRVADVEKAEAHEILSDREYEVMMLMGQGKSVTEVANLLNLSVKTISTYRSRIFDKLHISTLSELIHYLISKGLILPE